MSLFRKKMKLLKSQRVFVMEMFLLMKQKVHAVAE